MALALHSPADDPDDGERAMTAALYQPRELEAELRRAVAAELDAIVRRVLDDHMARTVPAADSDRVEALVRDALRNIAFPEALAGSSLARGTGVAQRAESVRDLLREAARHCFGDSPSERLLRDVFTRGHLQTTTTHEQAASELHLSRATYFRRLRVATSRVCAYLAAERASLRRAGVSI